ncbi:MAG: DNA alkylation repair protein [Candidatus Paceibacterota bacterium]|jgi:3-methyladenine DNA glycosylase AlkD
MNINQIKKELRQKANPKKAKILLRFFKTGKGEYGEGDKFLGLTSQQIKDVARQYQDLNLGDLKKLLTSHVHEDRVVALRILVARYQKNKKQIFNFYIKNISRINNWDLVDLSAPNIVGDYLLNYFKKKETHKLLFKLAKSKNIWSRRVAVLATFAFIKNGRFKESLELSEFLLITQKDSHDLMHKAVGWMLREVGKRELKVLENFLNKFGPQLPRTTLRYAIERFTEAKRSIYLKAKKRN